MSSVSEGETLLSIPFQWKKRTIVVIVCERDRSDVAHVGGESARIELLKVTGSVIPQDHLRGRGITSAHTDARDEVKLRQRDSIHQPIGESRRQTEQRGPKGRRVETGGRTWPSLSTSSHATLMRCTFVDDEIMYRVVLHIPLPRLRMTCT